MSVPTFDLSTTSAQYVTPQQLAEYWQVSDRVVREWFYDGKLTGAVVGTAIRIDTSSARKFERRKTLRELPTHR